MAPPLNKNVKTYLYRITNLTNGNNYVGITTKYKKRWGEHIKDSQKEERKGESLIAKAIRKYGPQNFSFEVIGIANTWEIACGHERLCRYFGMGDYNKTVGGDGATGYTHSMETKAKLSAIAIASGRRPPVNYEITARRMETLRAVNALPETKKRRSDAAKLALSGSDVRAKISLGVKTACASPEAKQLKSDITKERWEDDSYREHMATMAKNRWTDPNHTELVKQKVNEYWSTPGSVDKACERNKEMANRPEVKEKVKAVTTNRWNKVRQLGLKNFKELAEYELTHETK